MNTEVKGQRCLILHMSIDRVFVVTEFNAASVGAYGRSYHRGRELFFRKAA